MDRPCLGILARYIIRACFSQERMVYVPAKSSMDGIAKVVYTSKDRKTRKIFNALDWLARLVNHVPERYEQTVRYYGYYSNKSRGMRKKAGKDEPSTAIITNDISSKESRRNWARLIQKIYETDPLVCPKCQGAMRIIGFIEDFDIIKRILHHLDLLDVRNHDPPQKFTHYFHELVCGETDAQVPLFDE